MVIQFRKYTRAGRKVSNLPSGLNGQLHLRDLLMYTGRPQFRISHMTQPRLRTSLIAFIALALAGALVALTFAKARGVFIKRAPAAIPRSERLPRVILWAWERPVDLHFIDPNETGVAFLARTIQISANEVVVRPRLQPLELPDGASVIAVARIETDKKRKPELSDFQTEKLIRAIAEMAKLPNVSNIQIDFDATESERSFYRSVIFAVRKRVPTTVGLAITALASWCTDDDWISDLPIDEAVPMLFRMGPDRVTIRNRLASGDEFPARPCRSSYGIATDEPLLNLSAAKRLYVFNPDSWTENSVRQIMDSRK